MFATVDTLMVFGPVSLLSDPLIASDYPRRQAFMVCPLNMGFSGHALEWRTCERLGRPKAGGGDARHNGDKQGNQG